MLEETKLMNLKKELVEFATLVECMLDKAITGLKDKNADLLKEVIEVDEPEANRFEVKLDEMCIVLIAQHQPAGKSLRTIFMASNLDNILERMGDHVVNISESSLFLIERPPVKPLIDTPRMTEVVKGMISDSIQSFLNEDEMLAQSVCERDNIVDGLRDQITRELITYMSSDPSTIERALHLMKISSNLERIADLTTNICEDVIYMVKGKVIKHHLDSL
jgi:phosphate transport system protein